MRVTKDHILSEIRRTAEENGGKPLGRERFATETGIREFDWRGKFWARWNDALREAGFGPNRLQQAYADGFLLERLAELVREIGRVPVVSELQLKARQDRSFPNSKVFERFGSKRQLLFRLLRHLEEDPRHHDLVPLVSGAVQPTASRAEEPPTDEPQIGFVYLLKSGRYYKIGRSNAAGRREREISLQLPEKAAMTHTIRTDDPVGIEAYWHQRFSDRRKNGEWFELRAADVVAFRRRKFM